MDYILLIMFLILIAQFLLKEIFFYSVIIYSPSCRSKPVWRSLFCETQKIYFKEWLV